MHPCSELLTRHTNLFALGRTLVCGQVEDNYAAQFVNSYALCQRYDVFLQWPHHQASFGWQAEGDYQQAVMYMPKAKAEANLCLQQLNQLLRLNALVWVVGETRGGINALSKLAPACGFSLQKMDSARRCALYRLTLDHKLPPQDPWLSYRLTQPELTIYNLPGVFSLGELDLGSKMLLASLDKLDGHVLDFACGSGVLSAVMAQRFTLTQLYASDVSALALASTSKTCSELGIQIQTIASDGFDQIQGQFDHIVTNPPFHQGRDTDHRLTQRFIAQMREHLKAQGKLWLVANKFLPYAEALQTHFSRVEILNEDNKFRVYRATK